MCRTCFLIFSSQIRLRRLRRLGATPAAEREPQPASQDRADLNIELKNANFDRNKNLGEPLVLSTKTDTIAPVEIVKMDTDEYDLEREDSGVMESMDTETAPKFDVALELRSIATRVLTTTNFCTTKFESDSSWSLEDQISDHLTEITVDTLCSKKDTVLAGAGCDETPLKRQKQNSVDEAMETEDRKKDNHCDAIFEYFNGCYTQVEREESLHKRADLKSASNSLLAEIKEQLVRFAINLLTEKLDALLPDEVLSYISNNSPFLPLFTDHTINHNFVQHLMSETYNNETESFTRIFTTLLNNIFFDMQKAVSGGHVIEDAPLNVLRELVDIKLLPQCVERPICKLIVEHPNFFPRLCSEVPAREISKVTFLAPFLSISIFADENPKFAEHHFKDERPSNDGVHKIFTQTIQNVSFNFFFILLVFRTKFKALNF